MKAEFGQTRHKTMRRLRCLIFPPSSFILPPFRFILHPSSFILALLLLAPSFAFADDSELLSKSGAAEVGKLAPWFSGWTLDNQVFNTTKAIKAPGTKRVALVFWATWCAPCRLGMDKLAKNAERLRADGTTVVLVNYKDKPEDVRVFLAKKPMPFTMVLDPFGQSEKTYLEPANGSVSLPRTVVVDADGLVKRIIGAEGEDYIEQIMK